MPTNNTNDITMKKSELEYVYSVLDLLNTIGGELRYREPSISRRILNLSIAGKNTIRKYKD